MVKNSELYFNNFKSEPDLDQMRARQLLDLLIPDENLSLDDEVCILDSYFSYLYL